MLCCGEKPAAVHTASTTLSSLWCVQSGCCWAKLSTCGATTGYLSGRLRTLRSSSSCTGCGCMPWWWQRCWPSPLLAGGRPRLLRQHCVSVLPPGCVRCRHAGKSIHIAVCVIVMLVHDPNAPMLLQLAVFHGGVACQHSSARGDGGEGELAPAVLLCSAIVPHRALGTLCLHSRLPGPVSLSVCFCPCAAVSHHQRVLNLFAGAARSAFFLPHQPHRPHPQSLQQRPGPGGRAAAAGTAHNVQLPTEID